MIALLALALAAAAPSRPETANIDVARYAGTWHEIARFDTFFERGCRGATATYALMANGDLGVTNACVDSAGRRKEVHGKAWVSNPKVPGKLRVQFFWPFSAPYWVLDVGPDYDWALVGGPDRSTCWILARAPAISAPLYDRLVRELLERGYDIAKLVRVTSPSAK